MDDTDAAGYAPHSARVTALAPAPFPCISVHPVVFHQLCDQDVNAPPPAVILSTECASSPCKHCLPGGERNWLSERL